jgi:GT2 family glycosyltransferase
MKEHGLDAATQIDISVVTHNSEKWIPGFIRSLGQQSFPLERINFLVNDCDSSDNSIDLIKTEISSLGFASVQISASRNVGFGSGQNINIRKGKSEFVLVANIDLEFELDSIHTVLAKASHDESDIASWEFRQKPYEHPKLYNPFDHTTSWSSSACILFRRSALNAVGAYDESIFMYCEDVDLSWRLRTAGYRLRYVPDAVCWHHTYEESKFKENQFIGSIIGNLMLRMRFGSPEDHTHGEAQLQQLKDHLKIENPTLRDKIISEVNLLDQKREHFSEQSSPFAASGVGKFIGWDYESTRQGSFYECQPKPSEEKRVGIIIRTYKGRWLLLKQAIASALNQTYKNIEVLIIEDGGKTMGDNIAALGDRRVSYCALPKVGRCVAGNFGLSLNSSDYFCILDDDDFLYADHVETMVSALTSQPDKKAAYCASFEIKTDIHKADDIVTGYTEHLPYHEFFHDYQIKDLLTRNLTPIQGVVFSRELYDTFGGFAHDLENLEDWDLWVRYSQGTDFISIPKTTSGFRTPARSEVNAARQAQLDEFYSRATRKMQRYRPHRMSYLDLHNMVSPRTVSNAQFKTVTHNQEVVIHLEDAAFDGSIQHYIHCGQQMGELANFYSRKHESVRVCERNPGFGRITRAISSDIRSRLTCVCSSESQSEFLAAQFGVGVISEAVFSERIEAVFDMLVSVPTKLEYMNGYSKESIAQMAASLKIGGVLILANSAQNAGQFYESVCMQHSLKLETLLPRYWDNNLDVMVAVKF